MDLEERFERLLRGMRTCGALLLTLDLIFAAAAAADLYGRLYPPAHDLQVAILVLCAVSTVPSTFMLRAKKHLHLQRIDETLHQKVPWTAKALLRLEVILPWTDEQAVVLSTYVIAGYMASMLIMMAEIVLLIISFIV